MARPKAFDESAVLDRAMELFWERGYESTSISDLEDRLGVGRQSLYNTFGDKHALFLKALERYQGVTAEGPFRLLRAKDAGVAAIRTFFDQQIEALVAPAPRRACLVANTIMEMGASTDQEVLGRCDQARRGGIGAFRNALRNAVRELDLPTDFDVDAGAALLMTHMYGLAVMAKAGATAKEMRGSTAALLDRLS